MIGAKLREGLTRVGYHSRPVFLIIGTQKGGTVALHNYLARHPDIVPANRKEIGYFDQDTLYRRGETWYHAHFPLPYRLGRRGVTFEATPEYLYYPQAAERIHSYDPGLKLIAVLREPVSRAFSAWNMFRHLRSERPEYLRALLPDCDPMLRDAFTRMLSSPFPEFDRAVRDEIDGMASADQALEPGYVRRGLYHEQLLRYVQRFGREKVLILDSARLKSDPGHVLGEIVRFLGLPPHDWHPAQSPLFHVGQYGKPMADDTRGFLGEFYRPHNEKLYQLLERDLGW